MNVMDEIRRFIAENPAALAPRPSVLELGSFAAQMLRDVSAEADRSLPDVVGKLWGVPVVERTDMSPGMWRLLDNQGGVIQEGDLMADPPQERTP